MDVNGTLDTVELVNIAKDDILAWPSQVHRDYPSTVASSMSTVVRPFTLKSADIMATILNVFNDRLGLPTGTLAKRHVLEEESGCAARVILKPACFGDSPNRLGFGEHTDYGSLVSSSDHADH